MVADHSHGAQTKQSQTKDIRARLLVNIGVPAILAAICITVYLCGIHPGTDIGDSAEFAYGSVFGAICHPPGYPIAITIGKLFSLLPIGPNIGWRISFMMVVFGTLGCLAMYGAIRRITSSVLAGIVAATTLAFSSVYWRHCLLPEAYVFYGAFLCMAVYASVRFVKSDRAIWLYAAALLLGISVWDRPSELAIVPAFLGLYWAFRKAAGIGPRRVVIFVGLFLLPFAITVSLMVWRSDPQRLGSRNDALRNEIISDITTEVTYDYSQDIPIWRKYANASRYALGLHWAGVNKRKFAWAKTGVTLKRYGWMLSGLGLAEMTYYPEVYDGESKWLEVRGGTAIGILGLALVVVGTVIWRKRSGWLILAWGMFLGNFGFLLWYYIVDNVSFTVPSLIGLSILVGLGAAGRDDKHRGFARPMIFRAACLIVPLFLLVTNHQFVTQNTEEFHSQWKETLEVAHLPWPKDCAIISDFGSTMALRYLLYVEMDRPDVYVMDVKRNNWQAVADYFHKRGRKVFAGIPVGNRSPARGLRLRSQSHPDLPSTVFMRIPSPAERANNRRPGGD